MSLVVRVTLVQQRNPYFLTMGAKGFTRVGGRAGSSVGMNTALAWQGSGVQIPPSPPSYSSIFWTNLVIDMSTRFMHKCEKSTDTMELAQRRYGVCRFEACS